MKRVLPKVFDLFEKYGRSAPEPMGPSIRIFALACLLVLVGLAGLGMQYLFSTDRYVDPLGQRLEGVWQFYNGASPVCAKGQQKLPCFAIAKAPAWQTQVEVPKLLDQQINEELQAEYWYYRQVKWDPKLRERAEHLSLTLGTIKGNYSVWINGVHVGSGSVRVVSLFPLPSELVASSDTLHIAVRVQNQGELFPGISHFLPILIGRTAIVSKVRDMLFFYRDTRIVFSMTVKFALFTAFVLLFVFMPLRREYLSFSVFNFLSGLSGFCYWQQQSIVTGNNEKQLFLYLFIIASLCVVPIFVGEFLRLKRSVRGFILAYSLTLFAIPVTSAMTSSNAFLSLKLFLNYLPHLIFIPSLLVAIFFSMYSHYRIRLKHRSIQVMVFTVLLFVSYLVYAEFPFMQFKKNDLTVFVDSLILLATAVVMIFDFSSLESFARKSSANIPKAARDMMHANVDSATSAFDAIVMVFDVVQYTKHIAGMQENEIDAFNKTIKNKWHRIVTQSLGQKLNDTGDGAVYAWTYFGKDEETQLDEALTAALRLAKAHSVYKSLGLRIGIASGKVKCIYQNGSYSFMGEPIITATRLESLAAFNGVLVAKDLLDRYPKLQKKWGLTDTVSEKVKGHTFHGYTQESDKSVAA